MLQERQYPEPAEIPSLKVRPDFVMPKGFTGKVTKLMNLDEETSKVLLTDISYLNIPIDPTKEFYSTLGELATTSKISLSRSFNISIGREKSIEVLQGLFSLNIDYTKLKNISYGEVISIHKKYPHPKTLNKKTTPEVRKQIGNVTAHTLKWYEGKSIDELLAGALPTQTFWDFAITCLKSGIKLNP